MNLPELLAEAEDGRVMYRPGVVAALVRVAMEGHNAMDYGTVREFSDLAKSLRALDAALASPQGTP